MTADRCGPLILPVSAVSPPATTDPPGDRLPLFAVVRGQARCPCPDLATLGAELGDGGIDVLRGPEHGGIEDQAERAPSWSSIPSRYTWWMVPRLPWHTSLASLCRDSWTVSCRFI